MGYYGVGCVNVGGCGMSFDGIMFVIVIDNWCEGLWFVFGVYFD